MFKFNKKKGPAPLEIMQEARNAPAEAVRRVRSGKSFGKNSAEFLMGFTLLYSVLILSITIVIVTGAASFIINQLRISGFARESQVAFYAALAGTECALWWDIQPRLKTTPEPSAFRVPPPGTTINCAGQPKTVGCSPFPCSSYFAMSLNNGACVQVEVLKYPIGAIPSTVIQSFGHNRGTVTGSTCATVTGAVQRALEVNY